MDERSRNEVSPQLLDLIPNEREWQVRKGEGGKSSEERKLELRLGPPGSEDWSLVNNTEIDHESLLSLGYFSNTTKNIPSSPWNKASPFPHTSSQTCGPKVVVELQKKGNDNNNNVFSPSPSSANTAVPNSSQKRTAPGPVVGWPPIRSFRKNLASSSTSSKPSPPESQNQHDKADGKKHVDKGMFVKINMDGVPIGRKVDLSAYSSYDSLSSAVDELFRGLLAAQRDASTGGVHNKPEEEKAITGLLDGSGEYTLVYEDNEGDRMLVGDVPWHMFVSTVKRLRVLKSSELSTFTLGSKLRQVAT